MCCAFFKKLFIYYLFIYQFIELSQKVTTFTTRKHTGENEGRERVCQGGSNRVESQLTTAPYNKERVKKNKSQMRTMK